MKFSIKTFYRNDSKLYILNIHNSNVSYILPSDGALNNFVQKLDLDFQDVMKVWNLSQDQDLITFEINQNKVQKVA